MPGTWEPAPPTEEPQKRRAAVSDRVQQVLRDAASATVLVARRADRGLGKGIAQALRLYRGFLSPILGRNCRFEPPCSVYAIEAVTRFGFVRGSWRALRRLARCHPWNPGGFDPVTPEKTGGIGG